MTVVAKMAGNPVAGATAYFLAADSSVVAEQKTDASGTASASVDAGGSVSVVLPFQAIEGSNVADTTVMTVLDVSPGDALIIDAMPPADPREITVSIPDDPDTATHFYLLAVTDSDEVPITPGSNAMYPVVAAAGSNVGFLVLGFDSAGTLVDSLFADDVPIGSGSALSLTESYVPAATRTFTVAGVDPSAEQFSCNIFPATEDGTMFPGLANGSATTLSYGAPAPQAGLFELREISTISTSNQATIVEQLSPLDGSATLDVGPLLLEQFPSAPSFDTSTHTLSLGTGGGGGHGDAAVAVVTGHRPPSTAWTWHVIAPTNDGGTIAFPTLPTDVFDYAFGSGDTITVGTLDLVASSGGYAEIRNTNELAPYPTLHAAGDTLTVSQNNASLDITVPILAGQP